MAENFYICLVAPLIVALLFTNGGARRFCTFFFAGITACLLSAYIGDFLMNVSGYSMDDAVLYITPISEELMKMTPLLFCYLVFHPKGEHLIGAAAAIGVGFATFENCFYILSGGSATLEYVMVRGLAVGVMHTVCAMAVPMVLLLFKSSKLMNGLLMFGMMSLAITYHGLYNLLVSVPGISRTIGYALPLCTVVGILILIRVRNMILTNQNKEI